VFQKLGKNKKVCQKLWKHFYKMIWHYSRSVITGFLIKAVWGSEKHVALGGVY